MPRTLTMCGHEQLTLLLLLALNVQKCDPLQHLGLVLHLFAARYSHWMRHYRKSTNFKANLPTPMLWHKVLQQ
jgi:hypothetical protein